MTARLTVVVLPAPLARPEAMLAAFPREPAVLWAPPEGPAFAGAGVAARIDVGRGGLRGARERGASLLSHARVFGTPPGTAVAPRWIGGLAFDPGRPGAPRWRGFGAGVFILPRWTYVRDGRQAYLMLAVPAAAALRTPRIAAECGVVERALAGGTRSGRASPPGRARIEFDDGERFARAVGSVLAGIAQGRLDKVVLARHFGLHAPAPLDVLASLGRLAATQPHAFVFALRLLGATFLGASPERLVRRAGARVDADALAGSDDGQAAPGALRSSRKDLAEHAWVVRAVRRALTPYCRVLSHPARPSVRTLPGLRHLWTPVRGTLRDGAHVLDLVAALHPTPAVGGHPRAAALRFLRAHEEPRGWYAGAFGWFDGAGDGEFAVAIRSGLVRGRRADVWAGAGVVAGSELAAELREIDRKLGTMLGALGAGTREVGR